MIWTRILNGHFATEGNYEIEIELTYTLPRTHIPKAEKYMLSIHGPWCMYRGFPTIKAAKAAAERVLAALKEEE